MMNLLKLFPLPKPMNPCFHPVMIRGHGDEEDQKCAESQIAAVIPIELVKAHGTDKTHEENTQPPSGERCADTGALSNEAVGAPNNFVDLLDAGACHNERPYWEQRGTSNHETGCKPGMTDHDVDSLG